MDEEEQSTPPHTDVSISDTERLKEEAKTMKEYLQEFETEFQNPEVQFFYVISIRWLRRWKLHVSFDKVTEGQEPDKRSFGQMKLTTINDELVMPYPRLIRYPQPDHYCNVLLKPHIQAERDYVLITEKAWNYISSKYGGITIKRPCYTLPNGYRKVEVMLKKVRIFFLNLNPSIK